VVNFTRLRLMVSLPVFVNSMNSVFGSVGLPVSGGMVHDLADSQALSHRAMA